jgi:hypothetical protein
VNNAQGKRPRYNAIRFATKHLSTNIKDKRRILNEAHLFA